MLLRKLAIFSQVFSLHTLTSLLYILHKQKAPINMLSHSKAPKTKQIAGYKHKTRPMDFFDDTKRAFILAPAIV